ncbi:LysR family transcriptional regulator [Acidimangrovimonas pyrenivorans]|uniref:LysR family transcriptional regulator n=1 Tax=Acidimangrovimonas pyrenivorans TaxID=2030798 RepID=A0ABV7AG53_9RHOB
MDFRQLRVFVAIFEAGSIVGAAEVLRSAPSVLAHHLRNLESRAGGPLFERRSRGVEPTELGQRLYVHARDILRAVDLAEHDLRDARAEISGKVVLSLAYSALHAIGPAVLDAVIERHPRIVLDIVSTVSGATFDQIAASGIDLAVAYNPSRDAKLKLTPLLEEDSMAIGKPEILRETEEDLLLCDFLEMPYILPRKGARGRAVTDDPEHQRLLEAHARMFTDGVDAAVQFAVAGHGCMIASALYSERLLTGRGLIGRRLIDPRITRTLFLCERKDAPSSRAIGAVREIVVEKITEVIRNETWPCREVSGLRTAMPRDCAD